MLLSFQFTRSFTLQILGESNIQTGTHNPHITQLFRLSADRLADVCSVVSSRSNMGMMNMAITVVRQDRFLGLWNGVWPVSSHHPINGYPNLA